MTVLDIWNAALAMLPHDRRIADINEDSTEALRCRDAWDGARKAVITAAEWGCLTRSQAVCGGCFAHSPMGMYEYPRPVGALRVIGLFDYKGRKLQAQAIDGKLVSRYHASFIKYIPDNEDTESWSSWFTDAVIAELAARIASTITGSMQQTKVLEQKAMVMLSTAKQIDAQEISYGGTDGRTYARARTGDHFRCES